MAKICIVGDPHFRLTLPYADSISDGRKSEWEAVKKTIIETTQKCDAIILMGDNFNSRNNPSVVLREFVEFLKAFGNKPVHILCGNHERTGMSTALDFLQKVDMPNWHVYTDITPAVAIDKDKYATFIPYTTPSMLGVTTKKEGEAIIKLAKEDVAFVHHALSGAKSTEFFEGEIVLDRKMMEDTFGMTFFGHLHKSERMSPRVLGTGNIFTQEVGEPGKSIWVWDSATNTTEEVPLPVRGIYKVVWEEKGISDVIPANSIVKCYVTSRETNIEDVKENLKLFDASIIVEQYPNERAKIHFEDGGLDLSVESMLKRYSEAKGLSYSDLKEGFELIK